MAQWQYLQLLVGYPGMGAGGRVKRMNGQPQEHWQRGQPITVWLEHLGKEGWELVSVVEYGDYHRSQTESADAQHGDLLYVFKRERPAD